MTDFFNGKIQIQQSPVTIGSGSTTSSNLSTQGLGVVAIILPSAFTGTTMTFNGSDDGTNFYPMYNTAGTALSCTIAASRMVVFSPGDLVGPQFIQLVSGSAEGGARTIQCVTRSFL